jgi:probable phosphomutase (TIGR03848 family)
MTTLLLIRHGAHLLGAQTIAGRTPGVELSPLGHSQIARMVDRLGHLPIAAVYSSPMERTRQTAAPLAERLGLRVVISEPVNEVDFGEWRGQELAALRPLDLWKRWNTFRSGTHIPGGENILEVQARAVGELLRLRRLHPDALVAVVSHGDVIRSALAYFLGIPLDLAVRMEISLASVSTVRIGDHGPWVLGVNCTGEIVLE